MLACVPLQVKVRVAHAPVVDVESPSIGCKQLISVRHSALRLFISHALLPARLARVRNQYKPAMELMMVLDIRFKPYLRKNMLEWRWNTHRDDRIAMSFN